jgi:hypothetical protein
MEYGPVGGPKAMGKEFKQPASIAAGRLRDHTTDERRELELLAEFMRHDSVSSLAGEIAGRLGANVRSDDLIAQADLDSKAEPSIAAAMRKAGQRDLRRQAEVNCKEGLRR